MLKKPNSTTSLIAQTPFSHKLTSHTLTHSLPHSFTHPFLTDKKISKMQHRYQFQAKVKEMEKMKFSIEERSPENESDGIAPAEEQRIIVPSKFITPAAAEEGFEKKEHTWSAMSHIPTDLSIQVQEITFYVHKYPLISKCDYFSRIELHPPKSGECCELKIDNFPGGAETFETILKFCYGLPISLNVSNVAALRCASEFLEMTEALEEGNLISKTEAFFTFVVLSSWADSITVLKSCETLSPWTVNLQIVRRCCDAIAWKICRETSTIGGMLNGEKWWFNDVSTLRIDYFTRIITGLKAKGMKPENIGSCIIQYEENWLPSIDSESNSYGKSEMQWKIMSGRKREGEIRPTKEQRLIVESLVSLLPPEKEAVPCKFLLKMLKMALLYSASPAIVSELEKRAGLVLESADVNDLLIPSYAAGDQGKMLNSGEEKTVHNTEVVQRILEYFLLYEQQQLLQQTGPLAISKLLDSYLAEIARDPNLPVTNFLFLAQSLPENARSSDDGLYRAIDTYLKTHPLLSDHERRRLCKVMNCGKLSLDACAHAAQNDRLPLRTMIEVLFSEQLKIRAAIQGDRHAETADKSDQESITSSTNKEVNKLKIELEKVKEQMVEVQRDYSELQQEYKLQKTKQRKSSGWTTGWKKIRKSSLFHLKGEGEETDDSQNKPNQIRKSGLRTDDSQNKPNQICKSGLPTDDSQNKSNQFCKSGLRNDDSLPNQTLKSGLIRSRRQSIS